MANWRCAACDTYNEPAEKICAICGSTPRKAANAAATPRKGASRPAAKRPSPSRPTADWRCTKCDTNNLKSDATCVVCGTNWKSATKRAATPVAKKSPPKSTKPTSGGSKKSGPRKPTPKKSASSSRSSGSAARKTTPRRPSSTASTRPTSSARPDSLFHPPPVAKGYTPPSPRPTPPPPPVPGPRWSPPSAPAKESNSTSCLGALVIGIVVLMGGKSCINTLDDLTPPDHSNTRPSAAASCPTRIAAELPSGDGAELVKAFRTGNKQITLCRTRGGKLFYFGEFSDQREPGIAMPAKQTSGGYEANNPPYRYDIHDGVVTIYDSGKRIGQEELMVEPSPD